MSDLYPSPGIHVSRAKVKVSSLTWRVWRRRKTQRKEGVLFCLVSTYHTQPRISFYRTVVYFGHHPLLTPSDFPFPISSSPTFMAFVCDSEFSRIGDRSVVDGYYRAWAAYCGYCWKVYAPPPAHISYGFWGVGGTSEAPWETNFITLKKPIISHLCTTSWPFFWLCHTSCASVHGIPCLPEVFLPVYTIFFQGACIALWFRNGFWGRVFSPCLQQLKHTDVEQMNHIVSSLGCRC